LYKSLQKSKSEYTYEVTGTVKAQVQ